jgi:pimeloyl-ACP methyl ester carboxylesterase
MATEQRGLNPRVRIEPIQDAGHGLPFEQPERLGEVVVSFLRELERAGTRPAPGSRP